MNETLPVEILCRIFEMNEYDWNVSWVCRSWRAAHLGGPWLAFRNASHPSDSNQRFKYVVLARVLLLRGRSSWRWSHVSNSDRAKIALGLIWAFADTKEADSFRSFSPGGLFDSVLPNPWPELHHSFYDRLKSKALRAFPELERRFLETLLKTDSIYCVDRQRLLSWALQRGHFRLVKKNISSQVKLGLHLLQPPRRRISTPNAIRHFAALIRRKETLPSPSVPEYYASLFGSWFPEVLPEPIRGAFRDRLSEFGSFNWCILSVLNCFRVCHDHPARLRPFQALVEDMAAVRCPFPQALFLCKTAYKLHNLTPEHFRRALQAWFWTNKEVELERLRLLIERRYPEYAPTMREFCLHRKNFYE